MSARRAGAATMMPAEPFCSVIVGVDGREGGGDALALGRQLLACGGALVPAHVFFIDPRAPLFAAQIDHSAARERTLERLGHACLSRSDSRLVSTAATSVGEGLDELALKHRADLIVVGACSRGPVGRIAVGDDSRSVLEHATCPVAVAPPRYSRQPAMLHEIGVAYDGSPESERALAVARTLAARRGADVRELPAMSPRRSARHPRASARPIDLLVIGRRDPGRIGRLLHRSASGRLTRPASVPLLIVPHPYFHR
ncbi:MAG TPA: universal stress protein [Solirubrobacteraceae bacterium]|nr:universal stress protein [Solirubrobacteraceae bacterium]